MDYNLVPMPTNRERLPSTLYRGLSADLVDVWHVIGDAQHFGSWSAFPNTVLCHLTRGRLETSFADGQTIAWTAGQVLCLRPSVQRRTRLASGDSAELEGVTLSLRFLARVDPLSFFEVPRCFRGQVARSLAREIGLIRQACLGSEDAPFRAAISAKAACLQILHILADSSSPCPDTRDRATRMERFRELADYMSRHFREDLTIAELSKRACLSRARFHAAFREAFGESPLSHIRRLRLEEAASLLLGTDLTVAEVGRAVGWEDPFYFSRVFKASHGLSPSEFRVSNRISRLL